jgi:GH15 family glucan-1,4-alpha-glucosidase
MSATEKETNTMATASKKKSPRTNHGDKAAETVREFQSAAAPSPFPPIADYAFLSDCHTGALVAPDGSVDWLCVPRFDSPSVFGTLLDREAGMFRFGPFGINVPSGRYYEAGTNVLITTWKTPRGWVEVRDALVMGPTKREDVITPHTRSCGRSRAWTERSRSSWCASRHSTTGAHRANGPWWTAAGTLPMSRARA